MSDVDLEQLGWPPAGAVNDPHLIALAQRVKNLGEADDNLAAEVAALRVMLDERLPTKDEMASLREILSNKAGREYLRKQFNHWGLGGIGLLASIYVARNYLSTFFSWLARVLN
jgi:hypothetical protein